MSYFNTLVTLNIEKNVEIELATFLHSLRKLVEKLLIHQIYTGEIVEFY